MTPEQAVSTVQDMIFRPGWKLSASALNSTTVNVMAEIETVDTSYPDTDGIFRVVKDLDVDVDIDVSDLDLAGLCHAIITELAEPFDRHEDREFLQVRTADGQFRAPLHPHTRDGKYEWGIRAAERAAYAMVTEEMTAMGARS